MTERAPREVITDLAAVAPRARARREQFTGFAVMGLPFTSGHVLGLRSWVSSSIGPPYTSVWHRDPDGRWSFWSTAAPSVSCTRYTGELSGDTRQSAVDIEWSAPDRMTVRSTDPALEWVLIFGTTTATRGLSAVARALPRAVLERDAVLRGMGPMAGRMLGAGRLAMTGRMPNGQRFRLMPSHVWRVAGSTARLEGHDLGAPAPQREQATIGDFRIPQRGLLAVGTVDFDPFDASRHSAAVVRPPSQR
jgi:hypothetical protein